MKSLSIFVVVAILSLAITPAVEAQGFLRILEVKVKPGYAQPYEDFVKKLIEANDKAESSVTWSGYRVVVGKSGWTYRFVTPFEKWAELDNEPGNVLAIAFGEKEAQRIRNEGTKIIESTISRIWRILPEASSNFTPNGPGAKFYDVQYREVKRQMLPEFWSLQRKWKAAYEASASKPVVIRASLVHGPSQHATFYRSVPFNTWAEREEWNTQQILLDHYGSEEMSLLGEIGRKSYVRTEHFVSEFLPELSRQPSETPTNEP